MAEPTEGEDGGLATEQRVQAELGDASRICAGWASRSRRRGASSSSATAGRCSPPAGLDAVPGLPRSQVARYSSFGCSTSSRDTRLVRLMGIVNVTPDSFSDGGLYLDADAAVAHGRELLADGADILDVGGESTRPGAAEVDADEERRRTEPVVRGLADGGASGLDRHLQDGGRRGGAGRGSRDRQRRHRVRRRPGPGRPLRRAALRGRAHAHAGHPADDAGGPDVRRRRRGREGVPGRAHRVRGRARASPRTPSGSTRASASGRPSSTTSSCCGGWASCATLGRPILIGTSRKSFIGDADRPGGRRSGSAARSPPTSSRSRTEPRYSACTTCARSGEALIVAEAVLGRRDWGVDERFATSDAAR